MAVDEAFLTTLREFASASLANEPMLHGRFVLESGVLSHQLRDDKHAAQLFVQASELVGLKYELTGALGKRTKFQVNEISQLVLLAEDGSQSSGAPQVSTPSRTDNGTSAVQAPAVPANLALNDDTLLESTHFTISPALSSTSSSLLSHIFPAAQPELQPLSQSILLALCLNIRNTLPSHGLTTEQMTPYVSRVLENPTNWSVYTMALLLRSRLESSRTRTVERSTLQLQALIDQIPTSDSTVKERLEYFHCLHLPSTWSLQGELGTRYLSIGVVRSALEIFEKLELWDDVVKCWVSLERPEKGKEIVEELLGGTKEEAEDVVLRKKRQDPQVHQDAGDGSVRGSSLLSSRQAILWCILGDLELSSSEPSPSIAQSHYRKALALHPTSARALRSLGFSLFTAPDPSSSEPELAQCIPYLTSAAQLNPLSFKTHFILGCAYVKLEDWERARVEFQYSVSLEDEDAESWSNLATCWIRIADEHKTKDEGDAVAVEGDEEVSPLHS